MRVGDLLLASSNRTYVYLAVLLRIGADPEVVKLYERSSRKKKRIAPKGFSRCDGVRCRVPRRPVGLHRRSPLHTLTALVGIFELVLCTPARDTLTVTCSRCLLVGARYSMIPLLLSVLLSRQTPSEESIEGDGL